MRYEHKISVTVLFDRSSHFDLDIFSVIFLYSQIQSSELILFLAGPLFREQLVSVCAMCAFGLRVKEIAVLIWYALLCSLVLSPDNHIPRRILKQIAFLLPALSQ